MGSDVRARVDEAVARALRSWHDARMPTPAHVWYAPRREVIYIGPSDPAPGWVLMHPEALRVGRGDGHIAEQIRNLCGAVPLLRDEEADRA